MDTLPSLADSAGSALCSALPSNVDLRGVAILQVLPRLDTGGVERGAVEITRAIHDSGGLAFVASAGGAMVEQVRAAGGIHVTLPLHSKNPWRIWRNTAALTALIRREGIHLVHARSRAPAWSALMAARRAGVAFVTTYHGLYSDNAPWKRFYNSVMAKGDRVIAISQAVAAHVRRIYGVDDSRLCLIPRGVALERFDPDDPTLAGRAEALARQWGLPAPCPRIILLPGRLTRWKGQSVLLDAMVKRRGCPAIAVFVGDDQGRTAYTESLRHQADRLGIQDRVFFVGECRDMPAAYALASLVVTPSTRPEPFGRTVIEAQAMRRPVIAAAHGGAMETIEEGVTGWLTPPGDATALAEAIDSALALPESHRAAMGARARENVAARFTTAMMQTATLAVYRDVLPTRAED